MTSHSRTSEGHRARLRQRFLDCPSSLSQEELLELLLTFAIPRRDVTAQAAELLQRFGTLARALRAPETELRAVSGIGQQAAMLLKLVAFLADTIQVQPSETDMESDVGPGLQPPLFMAPSPEVEAPRHDRPRKAMFAFVNDEAANSLEFLPKVAGFADLEEYKRYLQERLPYNSATTRRKRAGHMLARLFPEGHLDTTLALFAARVDAADLEPVVFYQITTAEPLLARAAEELVWPALAQGRVEREEVKELVLRHLPELKPSSVDKVIQSVFRTYSSLGVAEVVGQQLRIRPHEGTSAAFVYVLSSEFPEPGMYPFEALEEGPARRWLLWDREWMRRQLYSLRETGLISKVSDIDAMRQFTLSLGQRALLEQYLASEASGDR